MLVTKGKNVSQLSVFILHSKISLGFSKLHINALFLYKYCTQYIYTDKVFVHINSVFVYEYCTNSIFILTKYLHIFKLCLWINTVHSIFRLTNKILIHTYIIILWSWINTLEYIDTFTWQRYTRVYWYIYMIKMKVSGAACYHLTSTRLPDSVLSPSLSVIHGHGRARTGTRRCFPSQPHYAQSGSVWLRRHVVPNQLRLT